jgi:hypothetical protein
MLKCALEVADRCGQLSDTLYANNWQDFDVLDLRESDEARNPPTATEGHPCTGAPT